MAAFISAVSAPVAECGIHYAWKGVGQCVLVFMFVWYECTLVHTVSVHAL